MTRLTIDSRIVRILECVLNAKHRYSSVSVTFTDGQQKVDSLYTAPSHGTGQHFLDGGNYGNKGLDDVLAVAQSFEENGDVKTIIKNVEKRKREVLTQLDEYKKRAKDLDIALTSLLKIKDISDE